MKHIVQMLLIGLLLTGGLFAQSELPRFVVVKSAVLPGWGEHLQGERTRGLMFNGIEAALWIFAGAAYSTATAHENDMYYYAAEHAGIESPQLKSDVFIDRVSKYNSMDDYNAAMLRNRQWTEVYSAENGQDWEWGSDAERVEFFEIKTQRYVWRQRLTTTFGVIALNHLVSGLDALYVKRSAVNLTATPTWSGDYTGLSVQLNF